MAHNIWNRNGKDAMFCVGDRKAAWHELGQRTDGAVTWQEAMRLALLDWTVSKQPLFAGDGRELSAWGIFREEDSAFLGTVGSQYVPIQNADAFSFVDTLLEAEQGAHYESAGALGSGERIWCLARVPGADFEVVKGDAHHSFLLFTTSHDGSGAATCKLTTVRVVCQNTLTQALIHANHGTALRVRHTKDAQRKMDLAQKMMRGVVQDAHELENKLKALAERKLTRESVTQILSRLWPEKEEETAAATRRENVLADVLKLYEINDRNAFPSVAGTAYSLLNAVTEWTDYLRGVKITERRKGMTEQQVRAENAIFEAGDAFKQKALDTILDATGGIPNLLDSVISASSR